MQIHWPNSLNWVIIVLKSRLAELMLALCFLVFWGSGVSCHIHHLLQSHLWAFLFWAVCSFRIWLSLHEAWLLWKHLIVDDFDLSSGPHVSLITTLLDLRQISGRRCCCVEFVGEILWTVWINNRCLALIQVSFTTGWVKECPAKFFVTFFSSPLTFWSRSIFCLWIWYTSIKLWCPSWLVG